MIRDMKNPDEKIGNNVWCDLPAEVVRIAQSMPKKADEIFPYGTDAIGAAFTRACQLHGIKDLHFHDLRHDGVSRLFETGLNIPCVAAVSGHRAWTSLKRYTHLRHIGRVNDALYASAPSVADGYDSDAIRDDLEQRGVTPVLPRRRNRKIRMPADGFIYALRNQIERCFSRLKQNRHIATRYDKTAINNLGLAIIGALRIWIRHFVNMAQEMRWVKITHSCNRAGRPYPVGRAGNIKLLKMYLISIS